VPVTAAKPIVGTDSYRFVVETWMNLCAGRNKSMYLWTRGVMEEALSGIAITPTLPVASQLLGQSFLKTARTPASLLWRQITATSISAGFRAGLFGPESIAECS